MSVENSAYPGTPDVEYIGGWVELKWVRDWPKREDTGLVVAHFTPQQRVWLTRRRRRGGAAWVLLQVGRCWLLFAGEVAAAHLGRGVGRSELMNLAHRVWPNGLRNEELKTCLIQGLPPPSDCTLSEED